MLIVLTSDQREALAQFAALEISIEELHRRMRGAMDLDLDGEHRSLTEHFEVLKPGIRAENSLSG